MPENGIGMSVSSSADNLEDAMWRLKIQTPLDGGVHQDGHISPYPDRPGEPDCIYYLRTGLCGYGSNCRFNHPPHPGQQVAQYRGDLPERVGQPDCQYFLKTGTCRFGATCKYNHPREKQLAGQVPLNILGLPMRQEEKPCPYYMRNWSCKFGVACKFHHPQPLGAVVPVTGPSAYGSTSSSVAPSSGLTYAGGLPAWSLPRTPYMSGARIQAPQAYMPVVLSPSQGIISAQQGWNTYTGTMNQVSSSVLGSNIGYNSNNQGELGSNGHIPLLSTTVPHFPDRPDQPECQFYMKTGSCKFGPTCKYHHPKERMAPLAAGTLGPYGLPLRPGQAICTFYSVYGICKFGSTCKFDHPLAGFYNYGVGVNVPTLTMSEPPSYPYHRNSSFSHSPETSPTKSSTLPDRNGKPETVGPKHQNLNIKESEDLSQKDHSPTQALESHDQSD